MIELIKGWYGGEYIPAVVDEYGQVISGGYRRRSLAARFTRRTVGFYLANWQFVWGSIIAIALGILAKI
jgi:hypothetical protein